MTELAPVLAAFLLALISALIPALVKACRRTSNDAGTQPRLKERLRDRIRKTWMPCIALLALLSAGCVRTVYVPHGEPVRLRETVKDVKVWVMGQDGKPIAGVMDLPEGWYALPMEPEE
ncbi:MAG TPA: hypothetical protein PKZ08_10060 [Vicinamibacterales bacterium]|nr:hypothetical protein [Vicinamibacterales bacterium]